MKNLAVVLILIGLAGPVFAERACDSKDKPFFTSMMGHYSGSKGQKHGYACMACAMENTEEEWNREQINVADSDWDSKYWNTAEISDQYWALVGVAARQLYGLEATGQVNQDDLIKTMIRISTALGPCREYFVDPRKPLRQQLRKDNPAPEGYEVKDLNEDQAITLARFAGHEKAFSSSLPVKELTRNQNDIAKAMGFEDLTVFPALFKKPSNFNSISHQQLRDHFRTTFQGLNNDAFAKGKSGKQLRSCLNQLKTNLSSDGPNSVPAARMCAEMTRSCFGNSDAKVNEICDQYGLMTPKPAPAAASATAPAATTVPANSETTGKAGSK